jgi:hypothetical protein
LVKGKIVRAGEYPLIEVNGNLQFQLPGLPVFPGSTDGLLLKPTLRWQIVSEQAAHFSAELDYITHGMSWEATYNVVLTEQKDVTGPELAEVVGWVTLHNDSGTDFPQATIQLMAGDVAKIPEMRPQRISMGVMGGVAGGVGSGPAVTQKEFDDFHLYDIHRTVSLQNNETKQLQFLDAAGVTLQRSYEFDGNEALRINFYPGYHDANSSPDVTAMTHIAVREEIKNSTANHLGMPLPAGRLRLYRREESGQMQFVGESMVEHTPTEQSIKVVSGQAFDVTATRKQTGFHVDNAGHIITESFEITVSNQKAQPVTVDDVEHMNRCQNWEITEKSAQFNKTDSMTAEFPVIVPAKGSATLTYSVRYTW